MTRAVVTDSFAFSNGDSAVFMTVEHGRFTRGQRVRVSRDASLLGEAVIQLGFAAADAGADAEGGPSPHAMIKGIACLRGDVIEACEG
ncbi:hypothetical protein [Embleya sp. NPDC001921]